METPRTAVVIEDDQDVRDLLVRILQQAGFTVHAASSGADGVRAVREHLPDVVTLDLGLPDIDGFEVARRIRLFTDTYIVMVTGRDAELDTLLGLESGADDYITKPFRPRELRARIAAMLRRPRCGCNAVQRAGGARAAAAAAWQGIPTSTPAEVPGHYEFKGLVLNSATRTARISDAPVELTRTEFDLLHALVESGRTVRTKGELVRRIRAEDAAFGSFISAADERALEVHIANLRRKLGDDPRRAQWLETVRGVGYRMAPE